MAGSITEDLLRTGSWLLAALVVAYANAQDAPQRGELRYWGLVSKNSPKRGDFTLSIEAIGKPDGSKSVLPKPLALRFKLSESAQFCVPGAIAHRALLNELRPGLIVNLYATEASSSKPGVVRLALTTPPARSAATSGKISGRKGDRLRGIASGRFDADGVCHDEVVVPMTFPILGKIDWEDTFLASRGGGERRHLGQDLIAPKMRPLVAAFDGVVKPIRSRGHNWLTLKGDNGWTAVYMHINIDTPGTRDAQGTDLYAFAPGIQDGARVVAGQLIAFCGDSGNARNVGPHLHFELHGPDGGVYNAASSLRAARKIEEPIPVTGLTGPQPRSGEVRLDGFVHDVGTDRVVVDVASTTDAHGETVVNVKPRRVSLRIGDGKLLAGLQTVAASTLVKGAPLGAILAAGSQNDGDVLAAVTGTSGSSAPPPLPPAQSSAETFSGLVGFCPKGFDSATLDYLPIIQKYAGQFHLEVSLVAAIIQAESSGNPRDVSSSGAIGLMQLMPENVVEYSVTDPFDPDENIRGGMAQLSDYIQMFGGDVRKGLAAFNGGPRFVKDGSWLNMPGVKHYVAKVTALWQTLKSATGENSSMAAPSAPAPAAEGAPKFPARDFSPSRALDMMLLAINNERRSRDLPTVLENGKLDNVAEGMVSTFAAGGGKQVFSDDDASRLVTDAGAKCKDVKSYCLMTDRLDGFGLAWRNVAREGSKLVGLAHVEMNGKHFWVVVGARV